MPDAIALYGSTRPGESEHYVVSSIPGRWTTGYVRGYLVTLDWGPAAGLDGFVKAEDGNRVEVAVLQSDSLAKHLSQIDKFEGDGYRREPIEVEIEGGEITKAEIYVIITDDI